MNSTRCAVAMPMDKLLAYWLRELDGAEESALEEHLFGCQECSARLRELARLGDGIKHAARAGTLATVVPALFIERLQGAGVRVRRYDVRPGGSVMCTATSEDDAVVGYLYASLRGVERLDLVIHDSATNARWRLEDIAFDPAANEVVVVPSVVGLRRQAKTTQIMQLLAVAAGVDRKIGEYMFNHTPS